MAANRTEEAPPPFAMIPLEVMMDKRLTLETMRVLITLFSFRRKNTDLVFPKRETIARRCNMHISNISSATTALVKLGWLTKNGSGGHSLATKYTITVPEIVAEQATVDNTTTVAQSATPPLAESATRYKPSENTRTEKLTEKTAIGVAVAVASQKNSGDDETDLQAACRTTWKFYSDAYFLRYGVEPVRNKKVNSQVKSFVGRLGFSESPHVAASFVSSNLGYYVQKGHTFGCLLADAEKLRTEWVTKRSMTATRARQIDRSEANFSAVGEAMKILEEQNHAKIT